MRTEIARWGNSLGLRVPKALADALGVTHGSSVELTVVEGALLVRPATPVYTLDDLLAGITPDNVPDEAFDDRPVGAEWP